MIIKHLTQYIIVSLRSATIPRMPREERCLQLSYILPHSLNAKEIEEEEMSHWSEMQKKGCNPARRTTAHGKKIAFCI